jgi:NADH-quinone oxidoreductase subunit M
MLDHVLSYMAFFPLAGAVVVLLLPRDNHNLIRWTAVAFTVPPLLLGIWLYTAFDPNNPGLQFKEQLPWIASYNIQYFIGVDGISVSMVLLTVLLSFLCMFASWGIEKGVKGYYALFLLLDTGMVGVFIALDFFLFYIFWEVMLLPMYFLIGIWGGPRREYAAIKFFLYTLFGSVLMLLAILALYFTSNPHTFDMTQLIAQNANYSTKPLEVWPFDSQHLRWGFQHIVWMALFIGFAIKIPAFPFHTWLPDAHVEAPTADLAYVFLGALGTWNIIYGALCAMAQKDFKKLVAYSSVSHMGYVMLGMASFTPQGINGAVLQMFNHGTITGMLFLMVGVIYDRAHHREIEGFGGLAAVMPVYTAISALAIFASMGLPGLSGFISEVLVLLGSWQKHPVLTVFAATGVILTAGYLLWTVQRVYLGITNEKYKLMPEINARELFTMIPLGIIVIIVGVYPSVVLDLLRASLDQLNQVIIPHLS